MSFELKAAHTLPACPAQTSPSRSLIKPLAPHSLGGPVHLHSSQRGPPQLKMGLSLPTPSLLLPEGSEVPPSPQERWGRATAETYQVLLLQWWTLGSRSHPLHPTPHPQGSPASGLRSRLSLTLTQRPSLLTTQPGALVSSSTKWEQSQGSQELQ